MRILLLAPFLPYPPDSGGRIRIYEIARGLALKHDVGLLGLVDPEEGLSLEEASRAFGNLGVDAEWVEHRPWKPAAAFRALSESRALYSVLHDCDRFAERLADRLRLDRPDVVQCEFSYMGQYRERVSSDRNAVAAPLWVLDEHNLEFRLNQTLASTYDAHRSVVYRLYARREMRKRREEELRLCREFDEVLTVSSADRRTLLRHEPGSSVTVVPNGVDLAAYDRNPSRADDRDRESCPEADIVFVGKMDYRPNADGVRWFCEEVLPILAGSGIQLRFTIVGHDPTEPVRQLADDPRVEVTGSVPDPKPYLHRATIVAVPLRAGSGTRLKVLEALAARRAVVTTSIGCEGLEVEDGRHLRIADRADGFAEACRTLIEDPAERTRLAGEGRRLVEDRYQWTRIVGGLGARLEALVEDESKGGTAVASRFRKEDHT